MKTSVTLAAALALALNSPVFAQEKVLRLLTWSDYVPDDVKAAFEKETGFKVEITLSSNDDMVAKLRASDGPAYDLAQPSQDRITGAQHEFKIYRPLDLTRVKPDQFLPAVLAASKKITTLDGKVYGLPHVWGTDGLVVNTKLARIADYPDLCKPEFKGKTAVRLRRTTLLAFAFARGKDPFTLYHNPKAYGALMDEVGKALIACKPRLKYFWDNKDDLLNAIRSDQVVGAMMSDSGGWKLNSEREAVRYLAPKAGALGWVDSYALPAKGRNDDAAYAWINFNMRPEIAAKVARSTGNLTAFKGAEQSMDAKSKAQFAASFPQAALNNIKWYPAAPEGLDDIEGRVLAHVKAAK
jgi:spermidine/putrescine transport system substrate-binding protein